MNPTFSRLSPLALGVLLVFSAGCIQRPASPREKRDSFDRKGLSDVILTEAPAVPRMGAVFGDAVELVGAELSPAVAKAGDAVRVTFYYRVLDEADEDYKVFVHADDRSGRADRINGDHWTANNRYPTTLWRKGEVVKDVWTLRIPSQYQGDGYDLWTGFYIPSKDERWPVTNKNQIRHDGQNRVLAVTVPVRP